MITLKKSTFVILFMLLLSVSEHTHAQLFPLPSPTFTKKKVPMLTQPSNIIIKNLYHINSRYRELNLSITPDGKYLYFMSTRGQQLWSRRRVDLGGYDGDIWYTKRSNGQWGNPVCLDKTVNNYEGQDEPNISPDGQTVYFEDLKNTETMGPYYSAKLDGTKWTNKKPLGGGIKRFYLSEGRRLGNIATDGMTMSPDGRTIILTSGKYEGNMNLYISKKSSSGLWSYPQKLNISTPGNERSPFLAADGKTLYFSSTGYTGKGGLDIFKCTLHSNGTASGVVNIGAPFNTTQDDAYFIISSDGAEAYFSRNYNIHYAKLKNAPKEMKPQATLVFSGVITDKVTKKPLRAQVTFKNAKGQVVATTFSNSASGEYSVVINTIQRKYYQSVSKPTYKIFNKTLNVSYRGVGKNIVHADAALIPPNATAQKKEDARKRQEALQKQKQAEQRVAAQKKAREEARKRREAVENQKLQVLKKKALKSQAKACVYKDFS